MGIKGKPYNLFILAGAVFALLSLFTISGGSTIDIHLHDSYFVVAHGHILFLMTFLSFFLWLLYVISHRFLLSKALVWAHVIVTLLTLLSLTWALFFGYDFPSVAERRLIDYNSWTSLDRLAKYSKAIPIIVLCFLLGQVAYVVNLAGGVFRRKV